MMFRVWAVLLALSSAASAADKETDAALERMKKDIFFLAGDECAGRGTGQPGNEVAGKYIAEAFEKAGLKPAGTKGYFQPFTIPGATKLGAPVKLRLAGPEAQAIEVKLLAEFTPVGNTGAGKLSGELVFVGYGITAEKLKYDDYAGLDVKGKVVVMLRRTPRAESKEKPFDADENSPFPGLATKVENAEKRGVAGIIFVNDRTYGKGADDLLDFRRGAFGNAAKIPVLMMKRSGLEHMLASQDKKLTDLEEAIDKDNAPRSLALTGWSATGEVTITKQETNARNVVGVLEGSGPLAEETVVVGAHYDHLGTGQQQGSLGGAAARGKVHFGADDNGSGTTGLMELARRYGAMKDRVGRRIVFIAFSGEELGLLGSVHYCKEPTFPLDKTAFMLNMDMIGRSIEVDDGGKMKDRLVVYGHGTGEGFEKYIDDTNKKYDFKLFKIPGGLGPSDHDSFYRKKIPVMFFFTGTHKDYHRPTDTPDKINVRAMKKVTDMAETVMTHFATEPERPKYLVARGGWEDPTEERRGTPAPSASRAKMPKLGIMPGNYEEEDKGVLVEEVSPGGAAEKAGLKAGDLIIDIGGKPVKNINGYMTILAGQKAGVEIEVTVMRKKEKVTVKATPTPGDK